MTTVVNPGDLREIRARKAELRGKLSDLRVELTRQRAEGDVSQTALDRFADLDRQLATADGEEKALLRLIDGGRTSATSSAAGTDYGTQLMANPEVIARLAGHADSKHQFGTETIGELSAEQAMDWVGAGRLAQSGPGPVEPTSGMGRGPFDRAVPMLQPPTTFLDMLPSAPLEAPSVPFAQEVSAGDGTDAAPVAPLALKPESGLAFVDQEANPETIAAWVKVSRNTLNDVPLLANIINTRLVQKVRQRLEREALSGDGSVSDNGRPGIVGILNTTGVADPDVTGEAMLPDRLLDGIVATALVGANPNVIALNWRDWAALLKTRSTGSGEYVSNPFLTTAREVWGLTFTPTAGVPQGTALAADLNIAATLLIREPAYIRVSDSDQDDFLRNKVSVLAEVRAALAVWLPAAIAIVSLTP